MEIEIRLPRPHIHQREILNDKSRWKILMCGRRWGKSQLAQILSIQKILVGEQVSYITPTFDLSRNFFKEILKRIPKELIKSDNKSELEIQLITGGSIKFFSGESLDRLRGYKFHFCIIDEAAYIPELSESWNSSIRPTLSDYSGGALFISTPCGMNFFYSLFLKGQDKNEPDFKSWKFSSDTNPFFSQDEFESARRELPKLKFEQEYLATPSSNQSNPFGNNIKKNVIPELSNEPTVIYGIDLAKYNDYTVIIGMDKNKHMTYFDRFQHPWELTMDRIINLPDNIPIYVDSTGVGDVMVELLQSKKNNINGVKFTMESKPKMIYKLIKDMEDGNIKYIEEITKEMEVFQYTYTSTGHIKFESQSGYHDDMIMSLALVNQYISNTIFDSNWSLYYV